MKPEIKKLWVNALRSGEFEQGTGALRRETDNGSVKYCCLGVLSELAYRAGVVSREVKSTGVTIYGGGCTAYLPAEVCEWAGTEVDQLGGDIDLTSAGEPYTATSVNDYVGLSFAQIADCVEESL